MPFYILICITVSVMIKSEKFVELVCWLAKQNISNGYFKMLDKQ